MPPETEQQKIGEPDPKKKEALLIMLAGIILALVAVSLWFVQQNFLKIPTGNQNLVSQDDVSDWQTYRNEEYGFEFKYPAEWIFRTDNYASVGGAPKDTFSITTISKDKKESFSISISTTEPSGFIYTGDSTEVLINGGKYVAYLFPEGYECYGDDIKHGDCAFFSIPTKKDDIWFVFGGGGKYPNLLSQQYLKILSTFKFSVTESQINQCTIDAECVSASYKTCCGSSERAINEKYADVYYTHPEWQGSADPAVCAIMGCPSREPASKTVCRNKICELEY